ncbi:hypothetical protein DFH06DRAFT_512352, partial [Mycena polygramma]
MHRCLTILEILNAICSNLEIDLVGYPWVSNDNRAALSALARTCTIFSDPALDALWSNQAKLDPFLRLFPPDLFILSTTGSALVLRWSILRPIMLTDWNRVSLYSSRVKVLSMTSPPPGIVDVVYTLSLSCPGGFLFPNLRTLKWPGLIRGFLPLRIFFPSTLQSISVHCHASSTNISLLSTLGMSCPRLRHVAITFDPASDHVNAATSLFVCALQHLRSLTIRTPSIAAMEHIAALPGLTSLVISQIPAAFLALGRSDPPAFGDLRDLTVGPICVEQATILLGAFSRHPFRSLNFALASDASATAAEALFQALETACSHEFLELFKLCTRAGPLPTPREQYLLTSRALGRLACFVGMKTLSIMSPVGFDLDDATLTRLSTAWPDLETLSLANYTTNPQPQNSIMSVIVFAQCPKLRSLRIEFDADPLVSINPTRSTDARVLQTTLAVLDVGASPISSSAPVARILSGFFPDLGTIRTVRDSEDNESPEEVAQHAAAIENHRLWKQVEEHIPQFVEARKEEQAWAHSCECTNIV